MPRSMLVLLILILTCVARAEPPLPAVNQAICLEASIEDSRHWTLITLKFSGDPAIEPTPWKSARRLELLIKEAHLPNYNQAFVSSGKLISEVALEQMPPRDVRLMMKVAAGTDVSVFKRRTPGAPTVEYAVLFEIPPDPTQPGGHPGGPLDWPVHGRLSSKYGWRMHPILHEHRMHSGVDIAVPEGTPIRAAQGGRVVHSASKGGAGLCVIIEHANGFRSTYGHCSQLKVKKGEVVAKNQVVALAGSTGMSTGPHVHFSITENGKQVDPQRLLGGSPADGHKRPKKPSKKDPKKPAEKPPEEHEDHDGHKH